MPVGGDGADADACEVEGVPDSEIGDGVVFP